MANAFGMDHHSAGPSIGERLRTWRKVRGRTLKSVADPIALKISTLSLYETGKRQPREPVVKMVAEELGLTLQQFYGDLPELQDPKGTAAGG